MVCTLRCVFLICIIHSHGEFIVYEVNGHVNWAPSSLIHAATHLKTLRHYANTYSTVSTPHLHVTTVHLLSPADRECVFQAWQLISRLHLSL